jgi:hypothetical protein
MSEDGAAAAREEPPGAGADVAALRERYLRSLDPLDAAADRVHQVLWEAKAGMRVLRRHLEAGNSTNDFRGLVDPAKLRASLSEATMRLERARHVSQRAMFKLLVAEGVSMANIARVYGISRQLVSRVVSEPDDDHA